MQGSTARFKLRRMEVAAHQTRVSSSQGKARSSNSSRKHLPVVSDLPSGRQDERRTPRKASSRRDRWGGDHVNPWERLHNVAWLRVSPSCLLQEDWASP